MFTLSYWWPTTPLFTSMMWSVLEIWKLEGVWLRYDGGSGGFADLMIMLLVIMVTVQVMMVVSVLVMVMIMMMVMSHIELVVFQ